jgi:hypothetical protein
MEPEAEEVAVVRRAHEVLGELVDNAGGYDKSVFRAAVLKATASGDRVGAWTRGELLDLEEQGRSAWHALGDLLTSGRAISPATWRRDEVLGFIATLRDSFEGATTVYNQGSCYRLYLLLAQVFKDAQAWTDGNHVVTRIAGRFYDISGEVSGVGFHPMSEDEHRL